MRFSAPSLVRARAQGIATAGLAAIAAVTIGWLFGNELVGVPGLVEPVPAVRVFPAAVAAIGAVVLLEPWQEFERVGARSVSRHRATRFTQGAVLVVLAAGALSWNAGVDSILVLALLIWALLAVAVGLVGRQWWVLVALALYGQLFVQEYERFRPGIGWAVLGVILALPCYLARGEAVLGRIERSPT